MNKFLIVCGVLMMSMAVLADDTTTETCANGAGTVVVGKVSGHKYCVSNSTMDWWNAYAWCDAQGKRLFLLDDCGCDWSMDCTNKCPELISEGSGWHIWTQTHKDSSHAYFVRLRDGLVYYEYAHGQKLKALCW